MKKIILAAIIIVTLAAHASAAPLSFNLNSTFKKAFPAAINVSWKANENFTTISFTVNNQSMQAFYNNDGKLVGTSRAIQLNSLPLAAIQALHDRYSDYTATEAIELNYADEAPSYYVSLLKNNKKVVLNITAEGELSVFQSEKF